MNKKKLNTEQFAELNKKASEFNLHEYIDFVELLTLSYSKNDLSEIFCYILQNQTNVDILIYTLKQIDKLKNKKTLDSLIDLLLMQKQFENISKNPFSQNVRAFCAKVIGNFKDQKSVYALLYCLNNKNENYKLRLACAEALGRIGNKYAVEPLINLVNDKEEKSVYVQESAVVALGMLGDKRALDPLVSILETKNGIIGKFSFLKERIIEVLTRISPNSKKVLKVMKNCLEDENAYVKIMALEALSNCDDSFDVVELVKSKLEDDNDEVKRASIEALLNLQGEKSILEIINSENYPLSLKEIAKEILEEYGDEEYYEQS